MRSSPGVEGRRAWLSWRVRRGRESARSAWRRSLAAAAAAGVGAAAAGSVAFLADATYRSPHALAQFVLDVVGAAGAARVATYASHAGTLAWLAAMLAVVGAALLWADRRTRRGAARAQPERGAGPLLRRLFGVAVVAAVTAGTIAAAAALGLRLYLGR